VNTFTPPVAWNGEGAPSITKTGGCVSYKAGLQDLAKKSVDQSAIDDYSSVIQPVVQPIYRLSCCGSVRACGNTDVLPRKSETTYSTSNGQVSIHCWGSSLFFLADSSFYLHGIQFTCSARVFFMNKPKITRWKAGGQRPEPEDWFSSKLYTNYHSYLTESTAHVHY
jgi:hypothetical protein